MTEESLLHAIKQRHIQIGSYRIPKRKITLESGFYKAKKPGVSWDMAVWNRRYWYSKQWFSCGAFGPTHRIR